MRKRKNNENGSIYGNRALKRIRPSRGVQPHSAINPTVHESLIMPTATQLNLPLDNEIGTLARLCRDLAHGGVNLLALSAPETGKEKGVVRLLVPNRALAEMALVKAGYLFSVEEVLFLELKNRPGALAKAVEKLARGRISIRYAYATASSRTQKTAAVIAVDEGDLPKALKLLG